jgi:hypothetical protein
MSGRVFPQQYWPWAEYLAGRPEQAALSRGAQPIAAAPARAGRCPPALELTIDVVFDGRSLIDCERARLAQAWHGREALDLCAGGLRRPRGLGREPRRDGGLRDVVGRRAGRASRRGDQARSR